MKQWVVVLSIHKQSLRVYGNRIIVSFFWVIMRNIRQQLILLPQFTSVMLRKQLHESFSEIFDEILIILNFDAY